MRTQTLKGDILVKLLTKEQEKDLLIAEVCLPKKISAFKIKGEKKVFIKVSDYNKYLLENSEWCVVRKGVFVIEYKDTLNTTLKHLDVKSMHLEIKELVDVTQVKIPTNKVLRQTNVCLDLFDIESEGWEL